MMDRSAAAPAPDPAPDPSQGAVTRDGFRFDPSAPAWHVRAPTGSYLFDFATIPVAGQLLETIRTHMLDRLVTSSAARARHSLSSIAMLARDAAACDSVGVVEILCARHVVARLERLGGHARNHLRDALVELAGSGGGGLACDLLRLIPRLEPVRMPPGRAVRTKCPDTGALPAVDADGLADALEAAHLAGRVTRRDYLIVTVIRLLGLRPLQVACLKARDLSATGPSGAGDHVLRVTRLKQGRDIPPRTLFRDVTIAAGIGRLLEEECVAGRRWAAARGLPPDEAPIFLLRDGYARKLMLDGWEGHMGSNTVTDAVKRVVRRLDLTASRTGEPLRASPVRHRRTLATRMFGEGASLSTVADLLDQTSSSAVLCYVETTPAYLHRVDGAVGPALDPFSRRALARRRPKGRT